MAAFDKDLLVSDKILSRIRQYSYARVNKFAVMFALPEKVETYVKARLPLLTTERLNNIRFNCSKISTPERRLVCNEVLNSAHESRVVSWGEIKPPIQLNFVCHNDMYEKLLFDYWLNYIVDHETRTVTFQQDYSTDIIIHQLDQKHDSVYKIMMTECFPTSVATYYYSAEPSTTPLIIDVTFSFSTFACESAMVVV